MTLDTPSTALREDRTTPEAWLSLSVHNILPTPGGGLGVRRSPRPEKSFGGLSGPFGLFPASV